MQMIVPRQVSRNAATVLRNAQLGGGAVWPTARQTILVLVAAFVMCLPFAQSAYAQSAGCNAINATWGGGVNLSNGNELWQDGLSVLAGETLTYSAVTSGTATPNSAGFAIYQNDGLAPSDILLEQYSSPGAELNLNNTLSIPEDDDRFILYAWSDPAGGTVQVTVTCAAKSDQTITFNNPGAQNFGTSPTLTASATSGLTPTFSSATTGVCTISGGGVLNFVTAGSCTINANQAGNASYNAAPQVQQTFTVNAVAPGQPTIGTASAGDGEASVSFTAPASTGGSSILGYTVTANPGGQTGTGSSSPITVAGLTNGTAYTFTVTATNSAGTGAASSASNSATPKASQTITFNNPGAQNFGTSPTLTASATSGLTPTFSSATTGVCTISGGGVLNFVTAGSCTINANQAGNASYNAAPQVQQTFTVNAVAPGQPTIGTASAGDGEASVSFTAPASTGGSSILGYTVTANPGGQTGTGSSSPITVAGLTNGTAYTFTVTATNSAGTGAASSASNSATPSVALPAPIANAVSATVSANSTNNAITLNITGGAAASVAVATPPGHGTATASGTSIVYTPTAGYSGPDSFAYTATNATGTSAAATVTITVTAPTFTFSPAAGALPSGIAGAAYSQTIAASDGTSPYAYTVSAGSLPAGLTLNSSTGVISGTAATGGTSSFTITATDDNGATGSASYSLLIGAQAPVANAVSATVSANSTNNAITLNITGGAAASVAVATPPGHGTATASGTSIVYTPTAGYSGPDSFAYTATNATGTSAAATVTITVTAPTFTFSPAAGALPSGIAGAAYSQTIAASDGTSPYAYTVSAGSLPAGLTLSSSTGVISGTAAAGGTSSFTITATDDNGATGSATYTVTMTAPATTFTFSPAAGALADAMAGEDYGQVISATGGTAPLFYSLVSGIAPDGLALDAATGALSGSVDTDAERKNYTFTVQVRDANGATGTASYSILVTEREVTVPNKEVVVPPGTSPNNVDLARGATGGPFISAGIVSVQPANAGKVSIVNGEFAQASAAGPLGWYLKFIPNPAFSGSVQVGFQLTSALGTSNTGTVTYKLGYDAAEVTQQIDGLVHGFVRTRQNMISSTIEIPGLLERRQMQNAVDPVSFRMTPSQEGMTVGFSTSLAQMESARQSSDGITGGYASPFNIWLDGTLLAHSREENDGRWGSFAMINLGADYLLSEKALVGISFHYDRMTDPTDEDAELTGNGWLAGPNVSIEIGKAVFWDTSLLYGGSANDIDTAFWDGGFDTKRWMMDTAVKGEWQLDEVTVLTPKLRAVYFNEKVEDYSVRNDAGDEISIDGFDSEQFRVSLGAEIARSFALGDGATLTPKLGLTGGYAGLDGSGAFASLTAGLTVMSADQWMFDASLLLNIEGEGEKSVGARARASKRF